MLWKTSMRPSSTKRKKMLWRTPMRPLTMKMRKSRKRLKEVEPVATKTRIAVEPKSREKASTRKRMEAVVADVVVAAAVVAVVVVCELVK